MVNRIPQVARIVMCSVAAAAAVTLSACRSSEPQQTVTAAYAEALSSIESLRVTATVARARIQTTLDYAGTRVAQADAAGAFLASNLISLGTESAFIEQNLQQVEEFNTLITPSPAANEPALSVTAQSPRFPSAESDRYAAGSYAAANFDATWTAPGKHRHGFGRQ